jgi:hypothetical protein
MDLISFPLRDEKAAFELHSSILLQPQIPLRFLECCAIVRFGPLELVERFHKLRPSRVVCGRICPLSRNAPANGNNQHDGAQKVVEVA